MARRTTQPQPEMHDESERRLIALVKEGQERIRNQSEDAHQGVERITAGLIAGGYPPEVSVAVGGPGVVLSYPLGETVRFFVDHFQREFTELAAAERAEWTGEIAERRPDDDADRIVNILLADLAKVHADAATKYFYSMLPQFAEMLAALAADSAIASARFYARHHVARDYATRESCNLRPFSPKDLTTERGDIVRRAAEAVTGILEGLKMKVGRKNEASRNRAARLFRDESQKRALARGEPLYLVPRTAKRETIDAFPDLRGDGAYESAMRTPRKPTKRKTLMQFQREE